MKRAWLQLDVVAKCSVCLCKLISVLAVGALSPSLEAARSKDRVTRQHVRLQLNWVHQFQFAGYYAAIEKGFYREAGLDVELLEGLPGKDFVASVVSGEADYGTELSDLLIRRNSGEPVVVMASMFQRSPLALIAREDSGIKTPADLVGRRVMLRRAGDGDLRAMVLNQGVSLDSLDILEHSFDIADLLAGRVDAMSHYLTSYAHESQRGGIALRVLNPLHYGVDSYGDCLFTSEQKIRQNPKQVAVFLAASLRGWDYALEHPREIAQLIQDKYAPDRSVESLLTEAAAARQLFMKDVVKVGHTNPERWQRIGDTYERLGMLPSGYSLEGLIYSPERNFSRTLGRWLGWILSLVALAAGSLFVFNRRLAAAIRQGIADLHESEGRFREMADSAPVMIWMSGIDKGCTFFNRPWLEFVGRTLEQEMGEGWADGVHADDKARCWNVYSSSFDSQEPFEMEYRIRRADGEYRTVLDRGRPRFDSEGQFLGYVGMAIDIMERKQLEEPLRKLATSFAHLSGKPFFEAVSRHLAEATSVDIVFVGILSADRERVTVLGGYARGELMESMTYELADTPCANVIGRESCVYPTGVADLFPKDIALKELAIDGYFGAPVFNKEKQPVGIVVAMSRRPLEREEYIGQLLTIYSDRVAAEMQRAASEDRMQRSEERFRWLFDEAADAIFLSDFDGKIVNVNQVACEQTGYSRDELLRLSTHEVETRPERAELQPILQRVRSGLPATVEGEHRRKDGSCYPVEVRMTRIDSEDGRLLFSAARDISERRRNEQSRRLSESRFRTIVESEPHCVKLLASDGRLLDMNSAGLKIIAANSIDQVRGMSTLDLVAPEYRESFQQGVDAVFRGENTVQVFEIIDLMGERHWMEQHSVPIWESDWRERVKQMLSVTLDITRRVQMEAERDELQTQLAQSQRMQSIGQLAGGVAHDFNNIVAAIMMNLEVIDDRERLSEESREGLQEIELCAKRAANLTRQLLMFSRQTVLKFEGVKVNELVENLLNMLQRLLGEQYRLVFHRAEDLPVVQADIGTLEQVLVNLLVNARDAMPTGGCINIRTAVVTFDDDQAESNPNRQAGSFVRLSVSDTGKGMDAELVSHIFEPFFTTKETGEGTGLGLATVHGIVAQHHGWLEVDSKPEAGSVFHVFLPATATSSAIKVEEYQESLRGGTELILVVEDEMPVRKILTRALRRQGYKVLVATNGPEALQTWEENKADLKLVLTDMIMPEGMTGLDLARSIRSQDPEIEVIISSGHNPEITKISSVTEEGMAYIQKPYELSRLSRVMRRCLDYH